MSCFLAIGARNLTVEPGVERTASVFAAKDGYHVCFMHSMTRKLVT